jgi:hypothetical protein
MTKTAVSVLVVTLAALLTAVLGVAHSSAAPTGQTLTFTARDEPGNFALDDLGAKSTHGPDLGDVLAFTQTLAAVGKTVGAVHLAAIGVDHRRHLTQATGTVVLPHGSIAVAGVVPQSHLFTLAVVGGTGAYVGARGTITVRTPVHTSTVTIVLLP